MLLHSLWISAVAAFISLDVTACWQIMISRPLVIGPLIGWMCGDFTHGLIIGAILEIIWINTLPLGASIPVDVTATAVVTVASAIFIKQWWNGSSDAATVLSIAYAVPLGTIIKKIDIFVRRFNNKLVYHADTAAKAGRLGKIEAIVLLAIALIFVKYFLFYFIAIYSGIHVLHLIINYLPPVVLAGLPQVQVLLIALGLATALDTFKPRRISRENGSQ